MHHAATGRSIVHVKGHTVFHELRSVLRGINFSISYGEFTLFIRETGSGKTSLLKTLHADLPIQIGEARVAGFCLSTINRSGLSFLRRELGIIFQDFQLLTDRYVEENLWFVLKATGWHNTSAEPTGSLNLSVTLGILGLFLEINRGGTAAFMREKALALL